MKRKTSGAEHCGKYSTDARKTSGYALRDAVLSGGRKTSSYALRDALLSGGRKTSSYALRNALLSGTVACAATLLTVMACGARESGSAIAPVSASTHFLFGHEAENHVDVDLRHSALGVLTNALGCFFWAALYEKTFGTAADRGERAKAVLGGAAIAGLAYATDYHIVPKRLSPGWEAHISNRSLLLAYTALGLSLPLRGLVRRRIARVGA